MRTHRIWGKFTLLTMHAVTIIFQWGWFIGMVVGLLVGSSCASPSHLTIFKTDTEWVDLREWPNGYTPIASLAHPYSLTSQEVLKVLQSVFYREGVLFSFVSGKPQHVFSDGQLNSLSENLSRAFEQVLPQEIVSFRIKGNNEPFRYTKGFCFIVNDEFHVIIEELRKLEFHNKENTPYPNPSHWELVPRGGQYLHITQSQRRDRIQNWVVVPLQFIKR